MVIKPIMFVPTRCMIGIADNVDFAGPYKTEEDHVFPHYLLLSRVKTAHPMADFDPYASTRISKSKNIHCTKQSSL